MATATFQVGEIHCASCENTITTALSQLPGVVAVVASAERNEVRVSFDDARLGEQDLGDRLGEVGFEPVG